jgi:hypothetical protein
LGNPNFKTLTDSRIQKPKLKPKVMYLKSLRNSRAGRSVLHTKTLIIMRLIAILTVVACFNASAGGYAQRVTLTEKNVSLEVVFKDIQAQTNYHFVYNRSWLQQTKKVSLDVKDVPMQQVLDLCFQDQPITYDIVDNMVSLKRRPLQNLSPADSTDPTTPIEVHGRVVDEAGKPVAGVTVSV